MKRLLRLPYILLLLMNACITGPESDKKSPLNYFNGEHYQAGGLQVGGIPLSIHRKIVPVKIYGKVVLTAKGYERRGRWISLLLYKNDKIIARIQSDEKGRFILTKDLPSGNYQIKPLDRDKYQGRKDFQIDSYELQLKVILEKTSDRPQHSMLLQTDQEKNHG